MNVFNKNGIYELHPFKQNEKWVFEYQNKTYDLAPAEIMNVVLTPLIVGVDRLLILGCESKKIKDPENGFVLVFSEEYFPNADVKLHFKELFCNGWVYEIEELNMKGIMPGQKAWICPYMAFFFNATPKTLFLKIENK